ncbi:MAG TPA: type II toxin-antitoxin system VapC family toxin [Verrucomicrobiae bacterium]|jgi:predicted nucleic acid-binding protein|nr:type II toxin-antitoxin system VapC family toxin [Verrucomicrobiae bacterium]
MTTAVDTNVIIALWDRDPAVSRPAQTALDNALNRGALVVSAPVFAELMAAPGRTETFLTTFFNETGISVEFDLDQAIWKAAGRAFQAYVTRRRKQRDPGPRRILADFLIGAHAFHRGYRLLTLDEALYQAAFSGLTVITP